MTRSVVVAFAVELSDEDEAADVADEIARLVTAGERHGHCAWSVTRMTTENAVKGATSAVAIHR